MSLLFKRSGILTTLQDLGRYGYQRFGINPTGAMDTTAARIANLLVSNDENEPVIEMHFPAPEIIFQRDVIASIAGAEMSATLNGDTLDNWSTFFGREGDTLRFEGKKLGNRAYLAIHGGLRVAKWLGSSSTNLAARAGGFHGRGIRSGDILDTIDTALDNRLLGRRAAQSLIPLYRPFPTVRVIRGAEFDLMDEQSKIKFETLDFAISNDSNRMGFRLAGDALDLVRKCELLSSAVSYGTIQLLPNGQMIVLMAAHQTTGGYPRIAHVISRDLPLVGQLGPGDRVGFHVVDIAHAEDLAVEFEREMSMFRVAAFGGKRW